MATRQLVVDVRTKSQRFVKGMKQNEQSTKKFKTELNLMQGGVKQLPANFAKALGPVGLFATAVTGASAVMTKFAADTVAWGDALIKTADQTNTSTDFLQKWSFAANRSGIDAGFAERSVVAFHKKLAKLSTSQGTLQEFDNKSFFPGLKADLLAARDTEHALDILIGKMKAEQDEAKRAALVIAAFGDEAAKMLPMINNFDELGKQAKDLGLVIGDLDGNNFEEIADQAGILNEQLAAQSKTLSLKLLPAYVGLLTAGSEALDFMTESYKGWLYLFNSKNSAAASQEAINKGLVQQRDLALEAITVSQKLIEAREKADKGGLFGAYAKRQIPNLQKELAALRDEEHTLRLTNKRQQEEHNKRFNINQPKKKAAPVDNTNLQRQMDEKAFSEAQALFDKNTLAEKKKAEEAIREIKAQQLADQSRASVLIAGIQTDLQKNTALETEYGQLLDKKLLNTEQYKKLMYEISSEKRLQNAIDQQSERQDEQAAALIESLLTPMQKRNALEKEYWVLLQKNKLTSEQYAALTKKLYADTSKSDPVAKMAESTKTITDDFKEMGQSFGDALIDQSDNLDNFLADFTRKMAKARAKEALGQLINGLVPSQVPQAQAQTAPNVGVSSPNVGGGFSYGNLAGAVGVAAIGYLATQKRSTRQDTKSGETKVIINHTNNGTNQRVEQTDNYFDQQLQARVINIVSTDISQQGQTANAIKGIQ